MHPIQIGACGWSYKDWVGPFYRPGLPVAEYLYAYAEHYAVVEVDSTFYRTPSRRMVEGWRDKAPSGFGFSLKVPRTITHEKLLVDCESERDEFLAAARLLEDKLRCCLLQFGYINRAILSTVQRFLDRLGPFLDGWPTDVPVAVEIRNKNWITRSLLDWLRARGVIFAVTDQEWMPAPLALVKELDVVTGPLAYVRLLGVRDEVERLTKTFDHIVVDRATQLQTDAEAIHQLADRVPVLVFVNNHFAGYAPQTIRQLHDALARL